MNSADIEDFLRKVDEVESQVRGIKDGSVDLDELDRKIALKVQQEKRAKEQEEAAKQARMREEARKKAAKSRVEDIVAKHNIREQRRAARQAAGPKQGAAKWDDFSDSEDSDEELYRSALEAPSAEQMGFMKEIERDADVRAENRRVRQLEGNKIKDEGNVAFKAGKFEEAEQLYSKALEVVSYDLTFMTNRALALIRLKRYDDAIVQCERALYVSEDKCPKAVHLIEVAKKARDEPTAVVAPQKPTAIDFETQLRSACTNDERTAALTAFFHSLNIGTQYSPIPILLALLDCSVKSVPAAVYAFLEALRTDASLKPILEKAGCIPVLLPRLLPLLRASELDARIAIVNVLNQIASDAALRPLLARDGCIPALIALLVSEKKVAELEPIVVANALAVLTNACLHEAVLKLALQMHAVHAASIYFDAAVFGQDTQGRVITFWSRCVSEESTKRYLIAFVPKLVLLLEDTSFPFQSHLIQVLAGIAFIPEGRASLVEHNVVKRVLQLISLQASDVLVANACLCISECLKAEGQIELVSAHELGRLFDVMHKKSGRPQKNAAIALARLARYEPHLNDIRERHGIELMHHLVGRLQ
eukprot:TRINITY_DN12785_c0_g1_i1.p1 TRINITY_DN12785_c0_g1~~TRINITY_DN12785_c0_g1_i1.p1  ORF type:complete len:592 (-),score=127.81 TRINITY_DN12785_c0_g1_i1:15-1790(-)